MATGSNSLKPEEIEQIEGLSSNEKEALLKVMERAKEFDQANTSAGRASMPLEGQLYKWTNPLKGWQPRWFNVDHEQGVLQYYTSEDRSKLPPRASLPLWGAVVSPSEEDSQSFAVQGANNETYKLRAFNAKDRQFWVSRLRQEVEHANSLAVGPTELLQSSGLTTPTGISPSKNESISQPLSSIDSPHRYNNITTPTKRHGRRSQLSAPITLSITKHKRNKSRQLPDNGIMGSSFHDDVTMFPGGDSMLDALTRLQSLQENLQQQLETHYFEAGVTPHDKNILLLKATSQAAVYSIHDSLAMMNLQMGRGQSPTPAHSLSPQTVTPTQDKKRPMSLIVTSDNTYYDDIQLSLEDSLSRSISVSEVQGRPKIIQKTRSKEAP